MVQRLIALLCALLLLGSFAACSSEQKDDDSSQTSASQKDDPTSAENTEPQNEVSSAEDAFDKAFEADKTYDIDAMAEVEYCINFNKTLDKDACIKAAKEKKAGMTQEQLKKYTDEMKDAKYTVTKQEELQQKALLDQIEALSGQNRDTDKIEQIVLITYDVTLPGVETYVPITNTVQVIKVDGTWYCYMGESIWNTETEKDNN